MVIYFKGYVRLTKPTGKLSPTSSHLFKLIIPIDLLRTKSRDPTTTPPTVFLLHPSQPLSHIGRLVAASLAPATPTVKFRCTSPKGLTLDWSDSTDLGDFIRDAARAGEFQLHIEEANEQKSLQVEVPTFADRTRFLRRRLRYIEEELQSMEALKKRCDLEAHQGARKMAVGGLAMLVVYWGTVARLTFWDLGWYVICSPIQRLQNKQTDMMQGCHGTSHVLIRSLNGHRRIYVVRTIDRVLWALCQSRMSQVSVSRERSLV